MLPGERYPMNLETGTVYGSGSGGSAGLVSSRHFFRCSRDAARRRIYSKGGRVIADWPGVQDSNLFENRDLTATTDLRAVLKGLLRDHLRVWDRVLATTIFPDSQDVKPIEGCVV